LRHATESQTMRERITATHGLSEYCPQNRTFITELSPHTGIAGWRRPGPPANL